MGIIRKGHDGMNTEAWAVTLAWTAARQIETLSGEIDSLAGEVVHAYEELSLLYDLGETLTGQLTVAQAADLILDKILNTLQAAWAELSLADTEAPVHVRIGAAPDAPSVPRGGEHRLSTTLRSGGQTIGSIMLVRPRVAAPFSSADTKLLDAVGTLAGSAIRNAQLYQELRRQAETDALTGLINHRTIQERLDAELEVAAAQGQPLAVMMIDIDDFKLFNDTYGHLIGDQILRLTSQTLREVCRAGDVAARYGGDEFIMLLPQTDRAAATMVARRLLDALTDRGVTVAGHETLPLALSIGVATFPEDAVLLHDLLSHADAALYETKRCGGNGVHVVEETPDEEQTGTTTFSALQGLVNAVDAKDRYTREHSDAVTQGALLLAKQLDLSAETCSALRIAGLLHDVGKIGIPDRILRKPGRLTANEYQIMQQHVALSELIIKEVPHLVDVLSAVAAHHERYDGRGYPRGLKGEEIPLLGRIMALADACSAMLLSRPYRKGMSWLAVTAELRRGAGTQFDPALIELFISAMEQSVLVREVAPTPHLAHGA